MTDALPSSPFESRENQNAPVQGALGKNRLYGVLLLAVLVCIGWFYAQMVDTEVLGFTHDDGVYAVAGKSLALGKGFKLLHVVGEPGEIKYPFVYPAILSLVWLVNPHFPQNLPALNYVTIGFTLAACGLCYLYYRRAAKFPGWLALLILLFCTANFYFIYFFSSVMSEAPYLFFSMLTLWTMHRFTEKNGNGQTHLGISAILLLIALSSLTFLTRVTGIALMAGIGSWLLLNRQWKNALIYGLGCLMTGVLPWMLWVKLNTPVLNDINYPLVNAYSNYGLELAHNVATGNYWSDLRVSGFSLVFQMLQDMFALLPNLVKIFPQLKPYQDFLFYWGQGTLACAYLLFGYFLLQVISFIRKLIGKGKPTDPSNATRFTPPALYLFFYILLVTLWNYEDQLARFLTPVVPLLWLYYFKPWARWIPELGQKPASPKAWLALTGALLTATLALTPMHNTYRAIQTSRSQHWIDSGKYRWMWKEYQSVFAWINHNLPEKAKLGAASDVVFYLYTNRPTFYVFYASLRRGNGKFLPESIPLLMKSLDAYGIQYLVAEPHLQARIVRYPVNLVAKDLLTEFPERFERIYTSPKDAIRIYKIVPPSSESPTQPTALKKTH